MKNYFIEEQKFTQWWVWLILIGIGTITIYGLYKQIFLNEIFGNRPLSNLGLMILGTIVFGLNIMFKLMRLRTEVNKDEIKIEFFPFFNKTFDWEEIETVKVIKYGFIGGWGIRFWTKYGTVYSIKGNKGLAIELRSGKKYLIGTQKEKELNTLLNKLL